MQGLNDTKNSFAIHQAIAANIHDINRGKGMISSGGMTTIGYGLIKVNKIAE